MAPQKGNDGNSYTVTSIASSAASPTTSSTTSTSSAVTSLSSSPAGGTSPSQTVGTTTASSSRSNPQVANVGQSKSSTSGGLSAGTVAGAAVAAAVGGALLAFIITFMFMRSQRQKRRETRRHSEKRSDLSGAKSLLKSSSDELVDPRHAWEKHLPQPADDNSIRLTIKTLLHQIELHVENFYTDSAAPLNMSEDVQTELLKLDSPFLPKPLAVLLPRARSQMALIKHCLSHLIVSHITAEGTGTPDTDGSFLPLEFVALPRTVQRTRSNATLPGKHPSIAPFPSPSSSSSSNSLTHPLHATTAFAQSLSRWRVLTSYLHPAPISDPAYGTSRDSAIAAVASTACTAFAPWSSRSQNQQARFQNLVTIMQSAADAGLLVFRQPAAFSWLWTASAGGNACGSTGQREIVVTPGFIKVTDDQAKVLARPQAMVQQVVEGF